jgi:multidrug efflux pump subunit AcrA (membrane-fusion protein)
MTNADKRDRDDEPQSGLVRRVLGYGPSPEERLEELLAQRREELDVHAARLRESIAELEHREELLRDSRASVERMLRMGTSDLEAREAELTDFLSGITEREKALSAAEADLARRRQELGAVELKRAAVERRERAAEAKESELAELEEELSARAQVDRRAPEPVELVFVPGERYRLVEIDTTPLMRGSDHEVDGVGYSVVRVGRSPLPSDGRRCAYLVRGRGGVSSSGGSS